MKVTGFTIVRNGVRFGYPFVESLRSLLGVCDEIVIGVGDSDDGTLEVIQAFCVQYPQASYFETVWPLNDPEKKKGGRILSEQTNLALARCTGDWCVYLQADEVLHEEDAAALTRAMREHLDHADVEALVFDYVHFYGSYDVVQISRSAYRREVRAVKRAAQAQSIGDAQSFRRPDGEKLSAAPARARVFHYGWVRPPEVMKEKTFHFDQLYHGDATDEQRRTGTPHTGDNYRYKRIIGLHPFRGSHPAVMRERVRAQNVPWDFRRDPLHWQPSDLKKIALNAFERLTGVRLFEYRSYRWR